MTPFFVPLARGCTAGLVAGWLAAAQAQPLPGPSSPAAASAPSSTSLADAVEAAWQRVVSSTESRGQLQRAQAEQTAAASPWAAPPSLEFGLRDDRWQSQRGVRESELGVALPLWLPGQQAARADAAEAGRQAAQAGAVAARHRVAAEVVEAAWGARLQQAEVDLAEAQVQTLQALSQDVARRVAAGDLARADALAARAEGHVAASTHAQARQRQHAATLQWTALTGLASVPDLPAPEAEARPAEADGLPHPDLGVASLNVALARRRLDVVQASHRDPPELVARWRQDMPNRVESATRSLGLALRWPLGTDARNAPLLAQALAERDAAEARLRRLLDQRQADIAIARAAAAAARQQWAEEQARAALLRERATLIDASFRAGETALPELLRALTAAAQADLARQRQAAALGLAEARLQLALGHQP